MPRAASRPDCLRLVRALADGAACPAAQLAARLRCSRRQLADCIAQARREGVQVELVRGRGYRLAEPVDLIDPSALSTLLAPCPWPLRVEVLDACPSTNTLLLERAVNGASHGSVLACEDQTHGRGRRGAQWISVTGGSLAFSLLWRFARGPNALSGLSLAMAVAVAKALDPCCRVGVKWPNDLLRSGRKLGGLLIELTGEPLGPTAAVIGVGINVRLPQSARQRVPSPVADLAEGGSPPSRTVLLARILQQMAQSLELFERQGFTPFMDEWHERHVWQGQRVALRVAEEPVAIGEALGVASDGALLLRSDGGVERFLAGELSLRSAEPA